jgi:hypothetical protein
MSVDSPDVRPLLRASTEKLGSDFKRRAFSQSSKRLFSRPRRAETVPMLKRVSSIAPPSLQPIVEKG